MTHIGNVVAEDSLFSAEDEDEVLRKMARRNLEHQAVRKRQRQLLLGLMGQPVIFGVNVGVVIHAVDEYETICLAHEFSRKTPTGKIRYSRETNARTDAVNPFDRDSQPDGRQLPYRSMRSKDEPSVREREERYYTEQLALALEYAEQWKAKQAQLADLERQKAALETEADGETPAMPVKRGPGRPRKLPLETSPAAD